MAKYGKVLHILVVGVWQSMAKLPTLPYFAILLSGRMAKYGKVKSVWQSVWQSGVLSIDF
jgi:hypothetical protein